jgi:hypothetical protein
MKRPPRWRLKRSWCGCYCQQNESSLGTDTAQKYTNVLVPFMAFERGVLRYFNSLSGRHIVVRDVPALVHSDEALGVNLLGMSFLSRVRWTHERGKLIIEQ